MRLDRASICARRLAFPDDLARRVDDANARSGMQVADRVEDLAIGTAYLYMPFMARSTTYSALRSNLKKALDEVCADHQPLRVERKNGESVVVISEADFSALEETAYLLRSPENARRLLSALHGDRSGDSRFADVAELRARLGLDR